MIKVLIVDDEIGLLDIACRFLELSGEIMVETCISGEEALTRLGNESFDVIVSDYQMPSMDGIALLKVIRARHADLPFIIFTGKGREEVVIQAFEHGADYYVQKGGSPRSQFAELTHKIRRAVAHRRLFSDLTERERHYQQLVESTAEGIWSIDNDGMTRYVNPAMASMLGYSSDEIIGEPLFDFLDKDQPAFEQMHLPGKNLRVSKIHELQFRRKDDTILYTLIRTNPLTDGNGEVTGTLALVSDITEKKKHDGAIIEFERKYRELAANIPGIVYRLFPGDPFRMEFLTDELERMTGYLPEELVTGEISAIDPIIVPSERQGFIAEVQRAFLEDRAFELDYRIRTKSGEIRHFIERGRPARSMSGTTTHIDGIIFDITERKEMEKMILASKQQMADIINFLPDATFVIDHSGKVIAWNRAMEKMTGVKATEIIGKGDYAYAVPFYGDRRPILIDLVLMDDDAAQAAYKFVTRDGDTIVGETTSAHPRGNSSVLWGKARPLYDSDGNVVGAIESIRDITELKQAEQVLRESETRFRSLIQNSSDIIRILDADGRIVFDSPSSEKILGYPIGSLLGKSPLDFIHPDDVERVSTDLAGVYSNTSTGNPSEFRIRKADGSYIYVESLAMNLLGTPGVEGVVITTRSITERKRAELALRESEEKYRQIVETAQEGIWAMDADLRTTFVNRKMAEMLGLPPKDIIGRVVTDFMFPDEIPRHEDEVSIRRKGIGGTYERRFKNASGDEVCCRVSATPLIGKDGDFYGSFAMLTDITERRRAELALQESESRYRNVVEDQTEFISRFTPDGVHVFVNDAYCRYFGYSREDILGHRYIPRIPPEERADVRRHFTAFSLDNPVATIEHRIIMPDGNIRWQRWSDRAIFDKEGHLLEFQSVGRDITEKKEAEHALQLANTKLNLLNSVTRHDILNKLTILLGYTELLKEIGGDGSTLRYAQKIEDAAMVIREQIDFTRDYQDLGVKTPVWQNVGDVAVKAASGLNMEGIDLIIKENSPEIFADPLLEKVFYNLIENTIKYGKTAMNVRVDAGVTDGKLVITVKDDGIGIPTGEKKKIFERGHGTSTGLGLFFSREILSITGITIRETGVSGKGACFEIEVPKEMYRTA